MNKSKVKLINPVNFTTGFILELPHGFGEVLFPDIPYQHDKEKRDQLTYTLTMLIMSFIDIIQFSYKSGDFSSLGKALVQFVNSVKLNSPTTREVIEAIIANLSKKAAIADIPLKQEVYQEVLVSILLILKQIKEEGELIKSDGEPIILTNKPGLIQ